jgi:hypothetical protein
MSSLRPKKYSTAWDSFHNLSRRQIKRYKKSHISLNGYHASLYSWFKMLEDVSSFKVGDIIHNPYKQTDMCVITEIVFEKNNLPRRPKSLKGRRTFDIDCFLIKAKDLEGQEYWIYDVPDKFQKGLSENDILFSRVSNIEYFYEDYAYFKSPASKRISMKEKRRLYSLSIMQRFNLIWHKRVGADYV